MNEHLEQIGSDKVLVIVEDRNVPRGISSGGPQGLIDEHLDIENCALLIGLFWNKFGTRGPDGHTPTEGEVRRAYHAWKQHDKPNIVLCFRISDPEPRSSESAKQQLNIELFKDEFRKHCWCLDYERGDELSHAIYRRLMAAFLPGVEKPQDRSLRSPLSLSVEPVPRLLRTSRVTERLGGLTLTLTGGDTGTEGAERRRYDVLLFTNPFVNFTNRLVPTGTGSSDPISMVYLYRVDANGAFNYQDAVAGLPRSNTCIAFENVDLGPSESENARRFAIDNLRVNASQLGLTAGKIELISVDIIIKERWRETPILIKTAVLGITSEGWAFDVDRAREKTWREMPTDSILAGTGPDAEVKIARSFSFTFSELAEGMFRTKHEEEVVQRTPDVSNATRLMVRFANVPDGVRVFVTERDASSNEPQCELVSEADPNGKDGRIYSPDPPFLVELESDIPMAEVKVFLGAAQAVWEWMMPSRQDKSLREARFGVVLLRREGAEAGGGTITVCGTLCPTSTVATASTNAPVPRFVDKGAAKVAVALLDSQTR